jgi:alkanesulfonate monooxygenase SsuD/methylene tetrahydromethanopterin reductase-like flavin-dependent oxidoreductase (luciferase family)
VRVDLFLVAGLFPGASHAATLRHAVSYARAAEAAGFDGVWMAEHHFIAYGVCPSAMAFAGFLLGHTDRIRVGTAAAILSNRHPVALAEEAVLLDALSGGRFDLGVARGGPWIDLDVFGTGLPRYEVGFAESLDLLQAWLSGRPTVAADGHSFRFPAVAVTPRPRRPVPTWVAATGAGTAGLAAACGLPLLLGMHATDADKRALIDGYRRAGGPPDAGHASAHLAYAADTDVAARAALQVSMPGWLATTGQYRRIDGSSGPVRDPHAYLRHLLDIHPVGSAATCVDRLTTTMRVTGVRHLLLAVEGAGDPEATLANIARLGTEVLPALRRPARPGTYTHACSTRACS